MAEIVPSSMAQQLATAYTQSAQSLLSAQTKTAQTTSSALTKLRSALQAFDGALASLSGKKSLVQHAATLSGGSGIGTVSASAGAQPGSYSLFVEQIASAHQVAFEDLPAVPVSLGGPIVVSLDDGSSFNVNLASADQDGDGNISQAEIARAINTATGNDGKVSAMVLNSGAQKQLVLSSSQTGAASRITVDASGLPGGALQTALSGGRELSAARDAIVWMGEQGTGLKLQQASNTFNAVQGVSMSFTKAMQPGDAPLTLTVESDDSGTAGNVRSFVEAYNALKKSLDELTAVGKDGAASAAFATDAGVRSLRSRMNAVLRQEVDGTSLMSLGIKADRSGTLSLDADRLEKALEAKPDALDKVFGSASLSNPSGILGSYSDLVDLWTDSANGQIQRRQNTVQRMQTDIDARQTRLELRYDQLYQRYLVQFTTLQALQARMGETTGLFDSLAA